jgi:predicted  nucleic acid-binding Zn-ribbon protein
MTEWDFLRWLVGEALASFDARLNEIIKTQTELKELIMGIKDDFAAFVVAVNERTNQIAAALLEIQEDIERLMTQTPPEVLAGMEEIKAKLGALATTSEAIAALDNPVVPPPVEPPPPEEPPL